MITTLFTHNFILKGKKIDGYNYSVEEDVMSGIEKEDFTQFIFDKNKPPTQLYLFESVHGVSIWIDGNGRFKTF